MEGLCNLCLRKDVPLKPVVNSELLKIYYSLTLQPFQHNSEDQKPLLACYICVAHLRKAHKVKMTCLKAEKLLQVIDKDAEMAHSLTSTFVGPCNLSVSTVVQDSVDPKFASKIGVTEEGVGDRAAIQVGANNELLIKREIKTEILSTEEILEMDVVQDTHSDAFEETIMTGPNAPVKIKCFTYNETEGTSFNMIEHPRVYKRSSTGKQSDTSTKCPILFNLLGEGTHSKLEIPVKDSTADVDSLKLNTLFNTGDQPYKCDSCSTVCSDRDEFLKHVREHTLAKPFIKCPTCQRNFSDGGSLKQHTCIQPSEKPFQCNSCPKSFMNPRNLESHIRSHVDAKRKPFKCGICQKSFLKRGHLEVHTRIHTGEKPFKCDVCQKSFIKLGDLKHHTLIHTGEKPFKCLVCEKAFRTKVAMQRHSHNVHSGK